MSEGQGQFTTLRQSADPEVVGRHRGAGPGGRGSRALPHQRARFAAKTGLEAERVIAAFLHAARLGIFELSWNVLCPGCGGVLDTGATLKTVDRSEYNCALCAAGYEPTLDEMVEVTFTVSPRVRRIAAHDPDRLPSPEYFRQIFWGSGIDLPDDFEQLIERDHARGRRAPAGREGASCRCSCRRSS